jgi:hypothetical protein
LFDWFLNGEAILPRLRFNVIALSQVVCHRRLRWAIIQVSADSITMNSNLSGILSSADYIALGLIGQIPLFAAATQNSTAKNQSASSTQTSFSPSIEVSFLHPASSSKHNTQVYPRTFHQQ